MIKNLGDRILYDLIFSSEKEIDAETEDKIITILKESECINESFKNTFPEYRGIYKDEIVYFGELPKYNKRVIAVKENQD